MLVIAKLIRAGVDPDLIQEVADAISCARQSAVEDKLAAGRRATADRQARFRERHKGRNESNVTNVTDVMVRPSRARAFCTGEELDSNPQSQASPSTAPKGAERARRISDDWIPKDHHRQRADSLGVDSERLAEIAEEFRNYWQAEGGAKARKLNWDLVFTNRLIDQAKRGRRAKPPPGQTYGTRNGKPSIQDFARAQDERINGGHGEDQRGRVDEIRSLPGRLFPVR